MVTAPKLPTGVPAEDAQALWTMQQWLLQEAQRLLWPANSGKILHRPVFTEQGPMVRNTVDMTGAYAELSFAARGFWPTVVFELAHETVHLLDPMPGNGNKLEEGVAVAFSIYAQKKYRVPVLQQPAAGFYFDALRLVRLLPGGVFPAARRVRRALGPLSAVRTRDLASLYPELDASVVRKLCRQMNRRRNSGSP